MKNSILFITSQNITNNLLRNNSVAKRKNISTLLEKELCQMLSTSLVINKMQEKFIMKYHYTPSGMTKI